MKLGFFFILVYFLINVSTPAEPAWASVKCRSLSAGPSVGFISKPTYPSIQSVLREDRIYREQKLPVELADGSIVEGSARNGGIQPDYRISLTHPEIQSFLKRAEKIAAERLPFYNLLQAIVTLTREELPKRAYFGITYRSLLRRRRNAREPIELGDYFERGCGVCRENALATHFALKAAGLSPRFLYIRITRTRLGREIEEDHAINIVPFNGRQVVVDGYFAPFHGKDLEDLTNGRVAKYKLTLQGAIADPLGGEQATIVNVKLPYPLVYSPIGVLPIERFSVSRGDGQEIEFNLEGRSQAERKFKREEEALEQAAMEDLVTVEWLFHPFYIPLGHTSLRIGNRIFEFTRQGWKEHSGGADSARAFLFNNPFFRRQYQKYAKVHNMSPFSFGIPLRLRKKQVQEIEDWMSMNPKGNSKPFSLLFNNCNHCVLEALSSGNVGLTIPSRYAQFSSVMSFRHILFQSEHEIGRPVAYLLSGVDLPVKTYREMVPTYLYAEHSKLDEIWRTIGGLLDRWQSEVPQ